MNEFVILLLKGEKRINHSEYNCMRILFGNGETNYFVSFLNNKINHFGPMAALCA